LLFDFHSRLQYRPVISFPSGNRMIETPKKNKRLPSPRVDLKMLASGLGLSQSTVSRALRGHPGIPDTTRHRVVAAAEKSGYKPNAKARGLALGRTETISLVFPLKRLQSEQTNVVEVLAGVSEAVTRRNYSLLLSPFSGDESAVLRKLASSKSVDGVIITRPLVHDPRIALLHELGLPFVVHGRSEVETPYSFADVDNDICFERLTGLLLDYGHRRIMVLNSFLKFRYAWARAEGFRRAFEKRGLSPDQARMFQTPMTEQAGYALAIRALALPERPTAFLCGTVFLARGVYRAAQKLGLKIGRDISVVAHDDGVRGVKASEFDPPLTATQSPIRRAGERAATFLIDQIERQGQAGPRHDLAVSDLVLRDSVGLAR
jgi:LacI family transcriptional regulator